MSIITESDAPKRAVFLGTSQADIADVPKEVRHTAGKRIQTLQFGGTPANWKPMPSVGPGVGELRISTHREHRVFFVARFHEAISILHAFEKKSQSTARRDIELGRARYQAILRAREGGDQRQA